MVMRQTSYSDSQSLESYRSFIEEEAIPIYEETLSNPDLDERKRKITCFSRFEEQLNLTILKYTLGLSLDEVKRDCEKTILFFAEYLDASNAPMEESIDLYILVVWTLSISYLCGASIQNLEGRIPFLQQDILIDRLYCCFHPKHEPSQKIMFPDLYGSLCKALGVYDDQARSLLIKDFLSAYFQGLKKYGAGWFDSHKEKDPEYFIHFGYWVFELGALVANIDWWGDLEFRDDPLYPKDLVDWKRANKPI